MNKLVKELQIQETGSITDVESNRAFPSVGSVGIANLCRICLENGEDLHPLKSEYPNSKISYSEKLNTCIPAINCLECDTYPKGICRECCRSLEQAYEFHILATKSTERLYEIVYGLNIKTETKYEQEHSPHPCSETNRSIESVCDLVEMKKSESSESGVPFPKSRAADLNKPIKLRKNAAKRDSQGRRIRKRKVPVPIHKCDICKMMFNSPAHVARHMRKHTGERPFICETCGKSFKYTETLAKHIRTHDVNRLRKLNCEKCGYKTDFSTNLKSHMRMHTGETPFPCGQCEKKFKAKAHLDSHIQRYHNELPIMVGKIQCQYCPIKCRKNSELRGHLRRHSHAVLYKCIKCAKTYTDHDNLVAHMKKVHQLTKWPNQHATRIDNPIYVKLN